jgi:anti-sigma B factor antagonist
MAPVGQRAVVSRVSSSVVVTRDGVADAEVLVQVRGTRPSTAVVSLVGVHDLSTAPCLERRALEQLGRTDRLVVDLSRASFVDSSIVNALVRLARQARPRGITFQVVAAEGSHPQRVLSLMGLLGHLGWVPSLRDASVDVGARPPAADEQSAG